MRDSVLSGLVPMPPPGMAFSIADRTNKCARTKSTIEIFEDGSRQPDGFVEEYLSFEMRLRNLSTALARKAAGKTYAENVIDFDYFSKIDLRVARVIEASYVEGADKLLKLRLDLGDREREIFSGIRSAYRPEDLKDRLVVTVDNLKPRKMRFGI